MAVFKQGDTVKTTTGQIITIEEFINSGSQGEVYRVDFAGKKKAFKWYINIMGDADRFYQNLKRNASETSPDSVFLWPQAITEKPEPLSCIYGKNSFGYIMDLAPEGFVEMSKILTGTKIKMSFSARVNASLNITSAFRILHTSAGCCYQDINDKNVFINPETGEIKIGDTDNVVPNGTDTGMGGTPRYMAPEIVTKGVCPNTNTDRHSMAVLLFILMFNQHPLEGKNWFQSCMTEHNKKILYGINPVFIEDPENETNRPDPVYQKGFLSVWECLPKYMKDFFCKAFSASALHDPQTRVREIEWASSYARFRNEIVRCPKCTNETFLIDSKTTACDACGEPISVGKTIEYKTLKYVAAANLDTKIYQCQLSFCDPVDALNLVATLITNSKGMCGVRNFSGHTWSVTTSKGTIRKVQPLEVVPFLPGIKIDINGDLLVLR